ncbi:hypothetical protein AALP_AA5G208800 [Arabis alpina]|uniref:WAT1-related protein n=1 Tax=Arabis alpina TaxID=50452 RepID=A0A087GYF2_ARAAL|nr:hypothetical protein AALP_AA5G208800 [Arabis alpina]
MGLKMSESAKPYFAMVCLQFGYAGMNLVTKVVLDRGMSHYVLVAYRNAFATAAIAPFALLSERKVRPKMTFPVFMQIFVLALLGPLIDQNLYYAGLKLTSPVFAGAVTNIVPALTFIITMIFRMEKVEIRKVRFQAKVVGTLVIVVGALLMILFKTPLISFLRSHFIGGDASSLAGEDYLKATAFLLIASFSWASFFVLQAATLKRYSSHLSLSTMVCFMGTLQSTALTFVMEPNLYAWNVGFDMNLLASVYAGIMSSSIAYYVQGMMTKQKSVVFVTAFNPLVVIIGSIIGFLILGQSLYLGGVLGMAILMVGVCAVLWGKEGDIEENNEETFIEVVKCCSNCENKNHSKMPRIDEEVDVEMQSVGQVKVVVGL